MERQWRSNRLDFLNAQISYHLIGNDNKETLLMLHPAFADHQIFTQQVEYFKEYYQILLIDMPGHGLSQIKGSKVSLKNMPDIIHKILTLHNIESCHLLGISLGSLVVQAFADRYPSQVKSVIIVGGYSIHKANERVLKAQGKEGIKWLFYILFSMKKFRAYTASFSCYTQAGRDSFALGSRYFNRKSFAAMAGMNSFFHKKEIPITYPLLIIVGEHDLPLIHEVAALWHDLEKASQLREIAGAGHCANVDTPNEFNKIVEGFLHTIQHQVSLKG